MYNLFNRKPIEKRKKSPIFLLLIFSWLIALFVSVFYHNYIDFKKEVFTNQNQIVNIKSWDTFKSISEKIDWVDEFWLNFYLRFNKPDYELQTWKYSIKANSDIKTIISSLKEPILDEENITILEWWNIYDIDNYLAKKEIIVTWSYIDYVTSTEKITALTEFFPFIKDLKTLEWFLYPDTYTISRNSFWINVLVIKQLENFEEKVYKKLLNKLDNETIEELINLASIVEKEEKNPQEKSTVAGILKKRLNADWQIWADITVCYPHELTSEECKMVVSKYINEKSEYNTRTMVWLPKTPIWNPSFETIEATLNHKKTHYWFYLHNVDTWKVYYGETNAEHENNKRLYLR